MFHLKNAHTLTIYGTIIFPAIHSIVLNKNRKALSVKQNPQFKEMVSTPYYFSNLNVFIYIFPERLILKMYAPDDRDFFTLSN